MGACRSLSRRSAHNGSKVGDARAHVGDYLRCDLQERVYLIDRPLGVQLGHASIMTYGADTAGENWSDTPTRNTSHYCRRADART
mgnify:FL=1